MAKRDDIPLSAARMFAAAGRQESLRAAALELGVSPSAVSHQVSTLEAWVGASLFTRSARKVELTPIGRDLASALDGHFSGIGSALDAARNAARDSTIRVSALPLFTNLWLIPRLDKFEQAHPGLSLEIESGHRIADFDRDNVDVAIRNTRTLSGGLMARKLLDMRAVPLCTPQLAAKIKSPADLADMTLIHLSPRLDWWPSWLTQAGYGEIVGKRSLTVDSMPIALEAAAQGNGVVLGLSPLIWDWQFADRLVVPFKAPIQSGGAYFMLYRRADRARRAVNAFADWLVSELRADMPRLLKQARAHGA
jgi:LysR family glycine cleavage system transcriptional activator